MKWNRENMEKVANFIIDGMADREFVDKEIEYESLLYAFQKDEQYFDDVADLYELNR